MCAGTVMQAIGSTLPASVAVTQRLLFYVQGTFASLSKVSPLTASCSLPVAVLALRRSPMQAIAALGGPAQQPAETQSLPEPEEDGPAGPGAADVEMADAEALGDSSISLDALRLQDLTNSSGQGERPLRHHLYLIRLPWPMVHASNEQKARSEGTHQYLATRSCYTSRMSTPVACSGPARMAVSPATAVARALKPILSLHYTCRRSCESAAGGAAAGSLPG